MMINQSEPYLTTDICFDVLHTILEFLQLYFHYTGRHFVVTATATFKGLPRFLLICSTCSILVCNFWVNQSNEKIFKLVV